MLVTEAFSFVKSGKYSNVTSSVTLRLANFYAIHKNYKIAQMHDMATKKAK